MNEMLKKYFPWALVLLFSAIALWLLSVAGQNSDEARLAKQQLEELRSKSDGAKLETDKVVQQVSELARQLTAATNELEECHSKLKSLEKKKTVTSDVGKTPQGNAAKPKQ